MHPTNHAQRAHDERNHPLMQRAQRNPDRHGFSPLALIAGVVAAVVCAFVWGAIYHYAEREIVWVALGVGAFVGGAMALARGRGIPMAVTAATLAIAAIVGGKFIGVDWSIAQLANDPDLMTYHAEVLDDAQLFAALGNSPTDAQIEEFIYERNYEISLADFRANTVPILQSWNVNPPSFQQWFEEDVQGNVSHFEVVQEELAAWDVLFALLAIATAFGAVFGKTMQEAEERAALARRAAQREQHREAA